MQHINVMGLRTAWLEHVQPAESKGQTYQVLDILNVFKASEDINLNCSNFRDVLLLAHVYSSKVVIHFDR